MVVEPAAISTPLLGLSAPMSTLSPPCSALSTPNSLTSSWYCNNAGRPSSQRCGVTLVIHTFTTVSTGIMCVSLVLEPLRLFKLGFIDARIRNEEVEADHTI